MSEYKLSGIYIYPIKSLGGISLQHAKVQERGLENDRRWMLVDEKGRFLTQRQHAQMALLQVALIDDGLLVTHKQDLLEPLIIPFAEKAGSPVTVTIWDDTCVAMEVNAFISEWFTKALGMPARLVYMPENSRRNVDENYALNNEVVSFADGYPILLIGQSSLDDLNSRLQETIPMDRFRPNLVFTGGDAFAEDQWENFEIQDLHFRVAKPCARCVLTTIDQETGIKSKEPLKTLSEYRLVNNKVLFGQNILYKGSGEVQVGDYIHVK
jgi:uncharacterized protein